MSILYVLIANGKIPIVIHKASPNPEAEQMAKSALQETIRPEQRSYFVFKTYACYIKNTRGITFLAVTDQTLEKSVCLGFLDDLTDRLFMRQTEQALRTMPANSLASFEPEIKECITKSMSYTSNIDNVKKEIETTKEVMLSNVEKLIERDGIINELCDEADDLNDHAFNFKTSANNLKKQMKCKNRKSKILIGGCIGGGVAIIVIILCVTLI